MQLKHQTYMTHLTHLKRAEPRGLLPQLLVLLHLLISSFLHKFSNHHLPRRYAEDGDVGTLNASPSQGRLPSTGIFWNKIRISSFSLDTHLDISLGS
jgi:hypothetical protein